MEYIRYCKGCNKKLVYKTFRTFNQAEQKKSLCRNCNNKKWKSKNPNIECFICKKPIYRNPSKLKEIQFCSYGCRNIYFSGDKNFAWKGGREKSKERNRESDKTRKIKYKLRAIKILGGKCSECGYNDCIAAFDFHHKNPLEKDYTIKNISSCGWEKIEKEILKCILLCSNCHRKHHWEERGNVEILKRILND